ncbi:SGNH/GDSL hydrolase family protein [Glacieibacterium sp.]|uniref:SGNH/GDSL hydrolase family protein n=1 Tax=Glacieibacterium sp. TaxID=2860237 RepID=UPI003AFF93A5
MALLLTATAAAAAPGGRPDALYVFGDSLVDAGNAYIGSGHQTAQPQYGYFDGRFTNGPDYTDLISKRLTGSYTVPSLLGGKNFAVGGARAAGNAVLQGFTVPGLPGQLGVYQSLGRPVDPNALYVINFGNNDVNAIQSGDTYGLSVADYSALYVHNIVGAVQALNAAGATRILVAGVPNPQEPEGVALQAQLDLGLDAVSPFLTASLYRFDFFSFFDKILADPTSIGLPADTDFVHPCIPAQLAGGFPPDCSHFFSFDGTHPTAPVQVALAERIGDLIGIGAVPEPGVWLQLIAGFGLTGTVLRRRRVVPA